MVTCRATSIPKVHGGRSPPGNVVLFSIYSTIPVIHFTPGKPPIEGVPRFSQKRQPTLQRFPVQPIAYDVAKTLITPLRGPVQDQRFSRWLRLAYHVGGTA